MTGLTLCMRGLEREKGFEPSHQRLFLCDLGHPDLVGPQNSIAPIRMAASGKRAAAARRSRAHRRTDEAPRAPGDRGATRRPPEGLLGVEPHDHVIRVDRGWIGAPRELARLLRPLGLAQGIGVPPAGNALSERAGPLLLGRELTRETLSAVGPVAEGLVRRVTAAAERERLLRREGVAAGVDQPHLAAHEVRNRCPSP